jgi:hypothetical protein
LIPNSLFNSTAGFHTAIQHREPGRVGQGILTGTVEERNFRNRKEGYGREEEC